jgi:predicted nucleic-acid-binding protein
VIAIDTNVLLRLFLDDDQQQANIAKEFLDQAAQRNQEIFITDHVLCELCWVLRSNYQKAHAEIADAVKGLLGHGSVVLQSPNAVSQAHHYFAADPALDFADCLLVALSSTHACDGVATFDRGMRKLPRVKVL